MIYFTHNEAQIVDIKKWCEERGEKILKIERTRNALNPITLKRVIFIDAIELPESFYNNLLIRSCGLTDYSYRVLND